MSKFHNLRLRCWNHFGYKKKPRIQDRDTCLCKLHDNARLLHEKLRQIKLIQNCSVADVVRHTVCNRELTNRSCMTNTCTRCKNHNFLFSTTHSLAEHDRSIRQFVLTSMIGSKLAKRTVHGSVNSLKASCQCSQFTETSHVHNIQSVQCYHSQKA